MLSLSSQASFCSNSLQLLRSLPLWFSSFSFSLWFHSKKKCSVLSLLKHALFFSLKLSSTQLSPKLQENPLLQSSLLLSQCSLLPLVLSLSSFSPLFFPSLSHLKKISNGLLRELLQLPDDTLHSCSWQPSHNRRYAPLIPECFSLSRCLPLIGPSIPP